MQVHFKNVKMPVTYSSFCKLEKKANWQTPALCPNSASLLFWTGKNAHEVFQHWDLWLKNEVFQEESLAVVEVFTCAYGVRFSGYPSFLWRGENKSEWVWIAGLSLCYPNTYTCIVRQWAYYSSFLFKVSWDL